MELSLQIANGRDQEMNEKFQKVTIKKMGRGESISDFI
jgi:hypothetical protein